ncbi:hypothetical protein GCM10027048_27800 [Hymenobacter coalescens]
MHTTITLQVPHNGGHVEISFKVATEMLARPDALGRTIAAEVERALGKYAVCAGGEGFVQ